MQQRMKPISCFAARSAVRKALECQTSQQLRNSKRHTLGFTLIYWRWWKGGKVLLLMALGWPEKWSSITSRNSAKASKSYFKDTPEAHACRARWKNGHGIRKPDNERNQVSSMGQRPKHNVLFWSVWYWWRTHRIWERVMLTNFPLCNSPASWTRTGARYTNMTSCVSLERTIERRRSWDKKRSSGNRTPVGFSSSRQWAQTRLHGLIGAARPEEKPTGVRLPLDRFCPKIVALSIVRSSETHDVIFVYLAPVLVQEAGELHNGKFVNIRALRYDESFISIKTDQNKTIMFRSLSHARNLISLIVGLLIPWPFFHLARQA